MLITLCVTVRYALYLPTSTALHDACLYNSRYSRVSLQLPQLVGSSGAYITSKVVSAVILIAALYFRSDVCTWM